MCGCIQSSVKMIIFVQKLLKYSEYPHVERHPRVWSNSKLCPLEFQILHIENQESESGFRRAGLERGGALAVVFQQQLVVFRLRGWGHGGG